jgi:hypothetical protein
MSAQITSRLPAVTWRRRTAARVPETPKYGGGSAAPMAELRSKLDQSTRLNNS